MKLEDILQIWFEEHHPIRENDDVDTDLFITSTVGDLRPRLDQGSRHHQLSGFQQDIPLQDEQTIPTAPRQSPSSGIDIRQQWD